MYLHLRPASSVACNSTGQFSSVAVAIVLVARGIVPVVCSLEG